ncbi:Purine catabolism PurC-like protein [Mycolicibacterium smegmatis]|nr:Purine catabolism PurC-like protein [Mycolicibacterium smegmatis]
MIPTVRDVIGLPVVQAGDPEVVSAENLDCPVRWVHVSDMPDLAGLLHGGELVLTTGAGLAEAPDDYLERMTRAGAVGLVVELGTRVSRLPRGSVTSPGPSACPWCCCTARPASSRSPRPCTG